MKRFLFPLILLASALGLSGPASAQGTCPYIVNGAVLTAAQWNYCFQLKNNTLGYTPVNRAGDTMQGRLVTALPGATSGFNIAPSSTPPAPVNGDIWVTGSGFFVQVGGTTIQPYAPSGNAGGVAYFTTPTTLASSATLTNHALLLGGGSGGSPTALGSLGTTTTLLHGNASGAPTFGAVSLTADVSGILPSANGGTANAFFTVSGPASSAKTFTFPNASATVLTDNAAVTGAQGGTGVANTGKTITVGASLATTGAGATTLAFGASTQTYTFPTGSETIVGRATTDTLTNKSISGSTNTLSAIALASLASQSADTFVMNATGSSASPTAVAAPTSGTNGCAGTSDALKYNTTTHALGCNTFTISTANYDGLYLEVGGGGSGGAAARGGGGGGGAVLWGTMNFVKGTVYTMVVGAGGAGPSDHNGANTTITGQRTATGGGFGGSYTGNCANNGSSGGGATEITCGGVAALGTFGLGTNGGNSSAGGETFDTAGGGGGCGSVGAAAVDSDGGSGQGGIGCAVPMQFLSPIVANATSVGQVFGGTGGTFQNGQPSATVWFGGGGTGGGDGGSTLKGGGTGGGGTGGTASSGGFTSGSPNTGGGGGPGNSGGSGVVVLTVPTAQYSGTTTGSPTVTTDGANTIIICKTGTCTYTGQNDLERMLPQALRKMAPANDNLDVRFG